MPRYRQHAYHGAKTISRMITDALTAYRGTRPQDDDVTLVVIKIR